MTLSRAPLSFSDAIDPSSPGHSDCADLSTAESFGKDVRQFPNAMVSSIELSEGTVIPDTMRIPRYLFSVHDLRT
jgi:hypothetical protein